MIKVIVNNGKEINRMNGGIKKIPDGIVSVLEAILGVEEESVNDCSSTKVSKDKSESKTKIETKKNEGFEDEDDYVEKEYQKFIQNGNVFVDVNDNSYLIFDDVHLIVNGELVMHDQFECKTIYTNVEPSEWKNGHAKTIAWEKTKFQELVPVKKYQKQLHDVIEKSQDVVELMIANNKKNCISNEIKIMQFHEKYEQQKDLSGMQTFRVSTMSLDDFFIDIVICSGRDYHCFSSYETAVKCIEYLKL